MMKNKATRIGIALLAIAALVVATAFLPHVIRAVNYGREVPVLMYHNVLDGGDLNVWMVSTNEFARQMDELKAGGWKTILPDDIWRASRGRYILPKKPIVLSFDDGYEGVMKFAEPILADHGFRAISYVILGQTRGEGEDRGVFDSGPCLSTNEVAAMAKRGTFVFGAHSLTHEKRDFGLLAIQIRQSRYLLRQLTGVKTHAYAYPYGRHGAEVMYEALRAVKFRTALVCEEKIFRCGVNTNLLAIPRMTVYGGKHDFKVKQASFANGLAKATVTNDADVMPVRCLLRERNGRRQFISDGPPIWIGNGRGSEGTIAKFKWTSLPQGLDASDWEAIVCEQNNLFTYGEPQPVTAY